MKPLRCVTLGGGTGHRALLSALSLLKSNYPFVEINAGVGVLDSGGSSGQLIAENATYPERKRRDGKTILPPGDMIQCLLGLSNSKDIKALTRLFRQRFNGELKPKSLGGHSVGNLLLNMLVQHTDDFMTGIRGMEELLQTVGHVYPVSLARTDLMAEDEDGTIYKSEAEIDTRGDRALKQGIFKLPKIKKLYLKEEITAYEAFLEILGKADVIFLGPGDMYSSTLAATLPKGIAQAIANSPAKKILTVNIMTKFGETDGFCVEDCVELIEKYLPETKIDIVIYNTRSFSLEVTKLYGTSQQFPILIRDEHTLAKKTKLVGKFLAAKSDDRLARHDSGLLSATIEEVLELGKKRKTL